MHQRRRKRVVYKNNLSPGKMNYKETIKAAYLDRIRHAPKEAKDIQMEAHSRYDRDEPWMQEVIAEVDKIAGPMVHRPLDVIRQEASSAQNVRDLARLDRELRVRTDEAEAKPIIALRDKIQEQVTPLVMQTLHRIDSIKGAGAVEQIETEVYARNGHPLKEADICDLFECSVFAQAALGLEQEERERLVSGSEMARGYFGRLEVISDFADLKKLHHEVSIEDRLEDREKKAIIKAIDEKSVVSSTQVNHDKTTHKEVTAALHAVEVIVHTNPELLTTDTLADVLDEAYRVIRLKEGFAGMAEKYPAISAHLVSTEAEHKAWVKEALEDQKKKDPDAKLGDMSDYGNLPQIGRGKGMPASLPDLAKQLDQYHRNKAAIAAFDAARKAEEERVAEAIARGEDPSAEVVSFGGGPRALGQPLSPTKKAVPTAPGVVATAKKPKKKIKP